MLKKFPLQILAFLFFSYCTQDNPDIRVICENSEGNYRIKWETLPPMKGTVSVYESNSPDTFNIQAPIATLNISEGFKDVFAIRNLNRSYFRLVFNNKYSVITAERVIPMRQLMNFRDLGGYYNENNLQTRWGKLYRSSSLNYATKMDMRFLDELRIKTVIDLRSENDRRRSPYKYFTQQSFSLPLRENPHLPSLFLDQILSKQMKKEDVISNQQNNLSYVMEHNSDYFEQLFDILTDKSNYPIVMSCALGKDKTGIVSALILIALGIDREQVIGDFLLSNQLINYDLPVLGLDGDIYLSDDDVQETMTAMLSAHNEVITYILDRVTKQYGSTDKFLENEIKLDPQKRAKLKELMLYH